MYTFESDDSELCYWIIFVYVEYLSFYVIVNSNWSYLRRNNPVNKLIMLIDVLVILTFGKLY